jgi:hypothetical protein
LVVSLSGMVTLDSLLLRCIMFVPLFTETRHTSRHSFITISAKAILSQFHPPPILTTHFPKIHLAN